MKVLDVKWYSGAKTVGFVLCETDFGEIKCYCSAGDGLNLQYDIDYIKNNGAKVEKEVAEAVFSTKFKNYGR